MKNFMLNLNKKVIVIGLLMAGFFMYSCTPEEREVCNQDIRDCVVGSILCTDGTVVALERYTESGKSAEGVVFYIDETGCHGSAVGLKDLGDFVWSPQNSNISSLTDINSEDEAMNDMDGYGNTKTIRSAGTPGKFPAAFSMNFSRGWYLPSCGQLCELMNKICVVNASLSTIEESGIFTQELNTSGACWWSSSESSASKAWFVKSNGLRYNGLKTIDLYVRDVHDF